MITVVVEGDTDVPFVVGLCAAAGFEVRPPLVSGGKAPLDAKLAGYAKAARGSPYLVVRDLDRDAVCAASWMEEHAPPGAGRYFALRLAVRAVEAWFLADREVAAMALSVKVDQIPLEPDAEPDPKLSVVGLARKSTKPKVREAIVPTPGGSRKAGKGYEGWLLEAATRWSYERAAPRSPSLARAHERLVELRALWEAKLG